MKLEEYKEIFEKNMKNDTLEMRRTYFQQIMKALDGKYKMSLDPLEFQMYLNKASVKELTAVEETESTEELLDCRPEDIVNVLLYETDYAVVLPWPAR